MIEDVKLILWKELKDFTGDLRHRERSSIIAIVVICWDSGINRRRCSWRGMV